MPFAAISARKGQAPASAGKSFAGAQVGIQSQRRADLQKPRLGAEMPWKVIDAGIAHRAAYRAEKDAVGCKTAVDRVLRKGFARLFDGANAHQKVFEFKFVSVFFADLF